MVAEEEELVWEGCHTKESLAVRRVSSDLTSCGPYAGVRVSQARVSTSTCENLPGFRDASSFECFGSNTDWDRDDEERSDFGTGARKFQWNGEVLVVPKRSIVTCGAMLPTRLPVWLAHSE